MFIGHFAVGMAAKSQAPKTSLGTFFRAAQFLDLPWPPLLLLSWSRRLYSPGGGGSVAQGDPVGFRDWVLPRLHQAY